MPLSGKTILVVEDHFLVAEDMRQCIVEAGGTAEHVVASEKEALDIVNHDEIDGALLDVDLRDHVKPVELARQLAARSIPFIVVTGYERRWLPRELQKAPYIRKPYTHEELTDLASRHFQGRR